MEKTPEIHALNETLQVRLAALLDLKLTLKHVHWNVVGPNFISVHEMLDDFVAKVEPMSDAVAERIRTLHGVPCGTPQKIVDSRTWDDYDERRGQSEVHLEALDRVFDGVIGDHRKAMAQAADVDPVTEDLLISQTGELELMQWFVQSFLERAGLERGGLERAGGDTMRFGSADRDPSPDESAAAEKASMGDDTAEKYKEMAEVGANAKGEGKI